MRRMHHLAMEGAGAADGVACDLCQLVLRRVVEIILQPLLDIAATPRPPESDRYSPTES
jgi:hypothetical protein